jgi:cell division septum initiation protein DivIVA
MSTEPPALGKGVFGYRKSAVNQIIADRDTMLRQAEGRVRAAEGKVSNLESELVNVQQRNQRMEEQLERLRAQVTALMGASPLAGTAIAAEDAPPAPDSSMPEPAQEMPEAPDADEADATPAYEVSPAVQDETGSDAWAGVAHPEDAPPYPFDAAAYESPAEPESPPEAEPQAEAPPMFEVDPFAPPEESASEQSTGETIAAPESPEPGFDVDAFGQHFVDYTETEEEASYGYRYDWSEPSETPEASAEPEPQPEPEFEAAPAEPEAAAQPEVPEPEVTAPEFDTLVAQEPPAAADPFAALVPSEPPAATAPPVPAPAPSRSSDAASKLVSDELAGILAAAEESAARIIERARSTTSRQVARSNRVWHDVQSEVSKFVAWRQGVEPVIGAVQSKVEAVRELIEGVPERIREALAPMAESISAIDADLADLAAASTPPLLLTPSDLEADDDVDDWSIEDPPHKAQASPVSEETASGDDDLSGPSYGSHTG